MHKLFNAALEKESDGLPILGLLLPYDEVYKHISRDMCKQIYDKSMEWLEKLGIYAEEQWYKGIKKCVNRYGRVLPKRWVCSQCKKQIQKWGNCDKCNVYGESRASGINSTGFNGVALAWNRLMYIQTISAKYAGIDNAPFITKIMQVIADDIYRMGQQSGKGIDVNAYVYKDLVRSEHQFERDNGRILPWDAILHSDRFSRQKAIERILVSCNKHNCRPDTWFGISKITNSEVKAPTDMICGCKVPLMSQTSYDWLKEMGVFGARPNTGN